MFTSSIHLLFDTVQKQTVGCSAIKSLQVISTLMIEPKKDKVKNLFEIMDYVYM